MKKVLHKFFSFLGFRVLSLSSFNYLKKPKNANELDFLPFISTIYDREEKLFCFDIGANVGQTSLKLTSSFPHATIFAFEPVLDTFNTLKSRLAPFPNINCQHLAIGDTEGEVSIVIKEDSEWNSLVPNLNNVDVENGQVIEKVQVTTLDTFLNQNNISKVEILKSDTEGFEIQVLEGAKVALKKQLVDFIYLEVGFTRVDGQHVLLGEIINFLDVLDYKFVSLFELSSHNGITPVFANALFISSRKIDDISSRTT